ncbi:hypothetical protein CI603_08025 [Bifidobacterium sp. wkB338]|nr:hypothetical protein CI603_08025 [Bifidobacterium sp. wkB338]
MFRANGHRQSQISTAQAARLGLRAYKNLLSIALVKKQRLMNFLAAMKRPTTGLSCRETLNNFESLCKDNKQC